jgi:hypothetical protein
MNGLTKKTSAKNMTVLHSEHEDQVALINWFRDNFQEPDYIIFAVPNGGTRSVREASSLKAEGVKAGVSDLIILTHGRILFLEMKKLDGKVSKVQEAFGKNVEYLGFDYIVGYGATDASAKVLRWLAIAQKSTNNTQAVQSVADVLNLALRGK